VKLSASIGLLAVPIGLLAIGCGGKGGSAVHGAGAAARARVMAAYARAVNIQAADVPGMSVREREGQTSDGQPAAAFRCGGGIAPRTGTVLSAAFVQFDAAELRRGFASPQLTVISTVRLAADAHGAARELAADRTRRVQACVGRSLLVAGGARGPLVRPRVRISRLPVSVTAGGYAFSATERGLYERAQPSGEPSAREQASKRFHLHQPRFTTDYLGFADGRAEVTLLVFRTTDAAPLALERRLLALLLARARANAARFAQLDSAR
jgi:hypothetical protein